MLRIDSFMGTVRKLSPRVFPEIWNTGRAPFSLLAVAFIALLFPLFGWIGTDLFSRPMRQLLDDPAGLAWASFAVLWSILGHRPDPRILVFPLLCAWCWGAGEGSRNLELLLPHFLWVFATLSLQQAGWTRLLGSWITLDALWTWYGPFFFPGVPWTCLGPVTLALVPSASMGSAMFGVGISLFFLGLGVALCFLKKRARRS
jgi:hypothetical protein